MASIEKINQKVFNENGNRFIWLDEAKIQYMKFYEFERSVNLDAQPTISYFAKQALNEYIDLFGEFSL